MRSTENLLLPSLLEILRYNYGMQHTHPTHMHTHTHTHTDEETHTVHTHKHYTYKPIAGSHSCITSIRDRTK